MKKPSEIKVVKAKVTKLIPSAFAAITLFGTVYCKTKMYSDLINSSDKIDSTLKCHETIHVKQAESTNNSWVIFYLMYAWQWICNLPTIIYGGLMPYYFIEFEAQCNEDNFNYPTNGAVYQWKEFKKLTLKEKMRLAKEYKKSKPMLAFRRFVQNDVLPIINKKRLA